MKILIAEDDFYCRKLMLACLKNLGECDAATNGAEAYDAYCSAREEGNPYNVVFLDIMMPVMDGQEVLRNIRADEDKRGIGRRQRVKILMVTALEDMKTIMSSYHDLCDAYVMKPIDQRMLLEQVHNIKAGI